MYDWHDEDESEETKNNPECSKTGDTCCQVGYWKNGMRHGYGLTIYNHEFNEFLFQNGDMLGRNLTKQEEITEYDPDNDDIAQPLDINYYTIDDPSSPNELN